MCEISLLQNKTKDRENVSRLIYEICIIYIDSKKSWLDSFRNWHSDSLYEIKILCFSRQTP